MGPLLIWFSSKGAKNSDLRAGTEHLLLTSAAQVGCRQQPLLRRVESADLVMPWSNGEQRRPHAVSCPQPADTGDTDNRYWDTESTSWGHQDEEMWLGALGSSRTGSNLVVIILKVESNVGLNVATKRDQKLGAPSELWEGKSLNFLNQ